MQSKISRHFCWW